MILYAARRLAYGVVVLWIAFTAAFLLLYALPGDAAGMLTRGGEGGNIRQELEEQRALLGLDRPLHVQYFEALTNALRGDFGPSLIKRVPATELFFSAFGQTLLLSGLSLVLAVILGVGLSVLIELIDWRWARAALLDLPVLFVSAPPFWISLLLLFYFSFQLRLIPATGNNSVLGLFVAAMALAIPGAGGISQLLSVNLQKVMSAPFVETLRSWGMPHRQIVIRHALRNAALPVITSLGTTAGLLLGGTVITETVFSRVGVGRIVVEAVDGRDVPVVLLAVVVSASVFVIINFVVDLLYPVIDKRISVVAS